MKSIIQFFISKADGVYTAEATGFPIVTQAETFEELIRNIKEAVEVYLHEENLEELGLLQYPSLLMNFEIPAYAS